MVNRIVTGAHYGMRDWLAQRITAVIMAIYSVIMAVVFFVGAPLTYCVWRELFSQGWMRVATLLFFPFAAWLLYLLDSSLASEAGFDRIRTHYLPMPIVKLGLLVFIWSYCHHFCAGIRFLLLDLNKGIELAPARRSAWAVLAVSLLLTAFFGWRLWSIA